METTDKEHRAASNKQRGTSPKRGQASLSTSHANLLKVSGISENLVNKINIGIAVIDENYNIIFINEYLSKLENSPIKAEHKCYEKLSPSGRYCDGCPLLNNKKIETIKPVSIEHTGPNSKRYIVYFQTIIMDNSKKALLEVWTDISGIKRSDSGIYDRAYQLESRVKEQLKLIESQQKAMIQQDKLASMGKLVASVAHEINNPIVFIRSNIEVLQKYWEKFQTVLLEKTDKLHEIKIGHVSYKQVVKELPEILASMYRGTDRIKNIVSNLKSFSRRDPEEILKEEVSLENVINESLFLVHGQIKNKIKVINNVKVKLPYISGNYQRLEQVFVNLFINAFEANATQLTINSKKELNNIILEIHDNGSGIPKNKIEKVFDPFFTTKGFNGTGLGLSISFSIIKEHEGTIEVSSKEEKGTIFTIKLPFQAKTILVVDDDAIILDIIKKVLTASGFLVEVASNGKEAVEKMSEIEPSLVITDIHMPEMNGFELIHWIRNSRKHQKIPILAISGVEKEISKIAPLPITDYISKPFSTSILAETVIRIVK